jgi:hypothetical protein
MDISTCLTFRVGNLTTPVYAAFSNPGLSGHNLSRRTAHLRGCRGFKPVKPYRNNARLSCRLLGWDAGFPRDVGEAGHLKLTRHACSS